MNLKRILSSLVLLFIAHTILATPLNDREYWVNTMLKIVEPVYENLAKNTLRKNMPVETIDGLNTGSARKDVTHLEALGRSFCGIAPWLNLPADNSEEGKLRAKYLSLTLAAITNAVDPQSPDYMPFDGPGSQPLVDAAFLAQGLLRAKEQVWLKLEKQTQERLIKEMKASRKIRPSMTNWLLFSATIEAALLELTGECEMQAIQIAIDKHKEWYKGDGWYGDGANFHFDYYNSFVIQPMLTDILSVLKKHAMDESGFYATQIKRLIRYAQQQEMMISPEATYPVLGRSMGYRFGAFQVLAQVSLMELLPPSIKPGQVRSALTAVIKRQLVPNTFDQNGWLTLGFVGHQPIIAEGYVSTGSAYLCTAIFLPLGLSKEAEFWSAPAEDWSSRKMWNEDTDIRIDSPIRD